MKIVTNENLMILGVVVISVILISGCIGEKEIVEEPINPVNAGEEIVKEEALEKTNDTIKEGSTVEEEPVEINDTIKEGSAVEEEPVETNDTEAKEETKEVQVEDNDTSWCEEKDPDAKIEEQTINGEKIEMCCVHYDGSNLRITFSNTRCYSKDGTMELRDNIEIRNDGSGSTRAREENWEENGKICKRVTDENGAVTEEGCTPKK
jgi:hypothetical protein